MTSVNHTLTGIYSIRSRSNFLSVFISNEIEENDIFGTEYVVMDESSFSFKTSGEMALTACKKSNIFLCNRQGTVRLFDSRLQLSKRTFCKILSNCRSERDVETGEIGQNQDITSDSEDLTAILSRRRSVRPPRHMEDFL